MRWMTAAVVFAGACVTPCEQLNEDLVALWESCGVEIPEELADGGKGECDTDADLAACASACWDAEGCPAVDGSDPEAYDRVQACNADCAVGTG
ncbi:MAG: hypothetical protein ABMA64_09375 [Myxococcota bacterium]